MGTMGTINPLQISKNADGSYNSDLSNLHLKSGDLNVNLLSDVFSEKRSSRSSGMRGDSMMQSSIMSMTDLSMQEEDPKSGNLNPSDCRKDLQSRKNSLSLEEVFL